MGSSSQDPSAHAQLADGAQPIRRWLQGFFRRRTRHEHDIDDMVQDVFLRIAARDDSEPVDHLGAYVMRTASNVLVDVSRRRSARRADWHISFDPGLDGADEIDPERILAGKEELHAATAALLSLPELTRTIFLLKRLEGYRHGEIAEHLGISLSSVEKHMIKAIRHLSSEMEARNAS